MNSPNTDAASANAAPGNYNRFTRFAIYFVILSLALFLRLICLAHRPFFCDVPASVESVKSGVVHIQFPGYIAYHQVAFLFSKLTPNIFEGFLVFTVTTGLVSTLYLMLAAEIVGGLNAAIVAGIISGFGLLDIYFSCTGTSYPADALAVAAMLYYGFKTIYRTPQTRDVIIAELWCCFGIAMRPVSSMWLVPAIFYLAWRNGKKTMLLTAISILLISVLAVAANSFHYYKSLADVVSGMGPDAAAAGFSMSTTMLLTGLFRLVGFPLYFFNVWLIFGAIQAFRAFRRKEIPVTEKQAVKYLLFMTIPYFFILVKHFPHPGYLCLLSPILCIFPLIFRFSEKSYFKFAAAFASISMFQLFVLRPVAPTSIIRCVSDTYFLQYSNSGIQADMFESLALLAWKNGVMVDKIPKVRVQQAVDIYGVPNGAKSRRRDNEDEIQ